jgi:hypothetical protein
MNKLLPSNAFHFLSLHGWKVTKLVVSSFDCEVIRWLVVGCSVVWVIRYFCQSVGGSFSCEVVWRLFEAVRLFGCVVICWWGPLMVSCWSDVDQPCGQMHFRLRGGEVISNQWWKKDERTTNEQSNDNDADTQQPTSWLDAFHNNNDNDNDNEDMQ